MAERAIEVNGSRIHYLEGGEGTATVFLHGAGGVPHEAAFIPALARQFHLIAPSQPGFDESTPGHSETVTDLAETMAAFIRETAGGPVNLIGESFGGWVSCWIAVLHPELVARLVLAAPAAFRPDPGESPQPLTPQELALRLFGRLPNTPPSPEEVQLRQRNAANTRRFLSTHRDDALFERLPDIQAQTLVLWSTEDKIIPPESAQAYQARIPNVYLMYIYGGAHSLPIAAADRFVELTTDFLERGEAFLVNRRRTAE
jgi:pimeloyl-ACP methyl ester carboxylesterase